MTRLFSFSVAFSSILVINSIVSAEVLHVADETTTGSGWRTNSVAKPNDIDNNNVYGSDGWKWFGYANAGLPYGSGGISLPASAANDKELLPSYITSITYSGSKGVNQWGAANTPNIFASFDDPLNVGTTRKGSIIYGPDGGDITITIARIVNSPAFRLTAFVSDNLAGYSEDITISDGTASDETTITPAKSTSQYSLFDVSAGSSNITIRLHNATVDQAMLTGLAFDHSLPEPSSIVLLSIGLLGLLAYAWRKRK